MPLFPNLLFSLYVLTASVAMVPSCGPLAVFDQAYRYWKGHTRPVQAAVDDSTTRFFCFLARHVSRPKGEREQVISDHAGQRYRLDQEFDRKREVVYFNDERVYVAFRGTRLKSLRNAVPDLLTDVSLTQSFIHRWNPVETRAIDTLLDVARKHAGKPIFLAGHSLGAYLGVMASLSCQNVVHVAGGHFFNPGYGPSEMDHWHVLASATFGVPGYIAVTAGQIAVNALSSTHAFCNRFTVHKLVGDAISVTFPYGSQKLYHSDSRLFSHRLQEFKMEDRMIEFIPKRRSVVPRKRLFNPIPIPRALRIIPAAEDCDEEDEFAEWTLVSRSRASYNLPKSKAFVPRFLSRLLNRRY